MDAKKIRKSWASAWANNNGRYTRPGALGNWACIAMDPLTVEGKSSDNDFSIAGDITNADGSEGYTPRFYHIQQSIPKMDYSVNASIVFKSSLSTAAETVIAFFKNGTILNTTNSSGIIQASAVQITHVKEERTVSFNFIVSLRYADFLVIKMGNFSNPAAELNVTFMQWTITQI